MKPVFKIILILSGLVWGQIENPVTITAEADSLARAGEVVQLRINVAMDKEWHIYSIYKRNCKVSWHKTGIKMGLLQKIYYKK